MSVQFKTPNITGSTDREKLVQIQSYLYQMAKQLQWAFDTIGTGTQSTGTTISNTGGKGKAAAADPLTTFAGLKNLIIKSADIVNAYYTEICKRLEGKYVAQSDFGNYTEQTSQEIQENSNNINQIFANFRTLSDTVDEMYNSTLATNAYIKTGLLAEKEDGSPIYGLEVGQTNSVDGELFFDKFARFTSEKLSFYDRNDVEVAYISDYHLHITNASISGTLTLMDQFEISCDSASVDFNWMGG